MQINPVPIKKYKKSTSLRRTKTDSVDYESIAYWLMTVEYKHHSTRSYHPYSLKLLTRLRDKLILQLSFCLVNITNVLNYTLPKCKTFFNRYFSKIVLYLAENYGFAEKMGQINLDSYDKLRSISRGKFPPINSFD